MINFPNPDLRRRKHGLLGLASGLGAFAQASMQDVIAEANARREANLERLRQKNRVALEDLRGQRAIELEGLRNENRKGLESVRHQNALSRIRSRPQFEWTQNEDGGYGLVRVAMDGSVTPVAGVAREHLPGMPAPQRPSLEPYMGQDGSPMLGSYDPATNQITPTTLAGTGEPVGLVPRGTSSSRPSVDPLRLRNELAEEAESVVLQAVNVGDKDNQAAVTALESAGIVVDDNGDFYIMNRGQRQQITPQDAQYIYAQSMFENRMRILQGSGISMPEPEEAQAPAGQPGWQPSEDVLSALKRAQGYVELPEELNYSNSY